MRGASQLVVPLAFVVSAAGALGACGMGGPPDDVERVRTGGSQRLPQMDVGTINSGTNLGNPQGGAVPDGGTQQGTAPGGTSQSGTPAVAGRGNDLTGGAGFEAPGDSDFIGLDEIDSFDDFQDVRDASNLETFGAGFATPSTAGQGGSSGF